MEGRSAREAEARVPNGAASGEPLAHDKVAEQVYVNQAKKQKLGAFSSGSKRSKEDRAGDGSSSGQEERISEQARCCQPTSTETDHRQRAPYATLTPLQRPPLAYFF